jgi:hypothetical protein
MPRFVTKGPVIPDELVQELEDDRVVIFCGAGISMGAGLPSYAGLVSHCFRELGRSLPRNSSSEWLWPDRMLGALESQFGALTVRNVVAERLGRAPIDLSIHQAILRLSRLRNGNGSRLVTTNFDTYFEKAAKAEMLLGRHFHSGPILPIPRNDHIVSWQSVVYLHGRLEAPPLRNDHLVLTSADFGRAYLTEGWAARFVARLFADFTVLFIGYSLNDPVLRYMTDAFAAEEAMTRRARARGPAYIFVPYKGRTIPDSAAFTQRNLQPIFYNQGREHAQLRSTLIAWAEAREDYLANTSVLISRVAPNRPSSLDPSDTANLLWAVAGRLNDLGHGARVFAAVTPPPPIEWLDEFERKENSDQTEYKQAAKVSRDNGSPPPDQPPVHIGDIFPPAADHQDRALTPAAIALIGWISQHLCELGLVDRVISKLGAGRRPHPLLRRAIRTRLLGDPALPDGYLRFWQIISAEGDWASNYRTASPLANARVALTNSHAEMWLRLDVLAGLRPSITFQRSYYHATPRLTGELPAQHEIGERLRQIARSTVTLADEANIDLFLGSIRDRPYASDFWASIIWELSAHLKRALDLFAVAGEAGPEVDPTPLSRPSIVPHAQNRNHEKWGVLFDLIWQGWTQLDAQDAVLSRRLIDNWRSIHYPAFERLALAAISHTAQMTSQEKLEALLTDGARIFWSASHRKETFDLLRAIWPTLNPDQLGELETAIITGPPAHLFERYPATEQQSAYDRRVFDRITVIENSENPQLTGALEVEARRLRQAHPHWRAAEGEQAHFGIWTQSRWGRDTKFSADRLSSISNEELVQRLGNEREDREGLLDAWRQFARTSPERATAILDTMGSNDPNFMDVWSHAIAGLRDAAKDPLVKRLLVQLIVSMSEQMLWFPEILRAAADALESVTSDESVIEDQNEFWFAFDRVLLAAAADPSNQERPGDDEWVTFAINSSMGVLATTFFNALFSRRLRAGDPVPDDLRDRFIALLSPRELSHRPARVVASSRLSYLYAIAPELTRAHLIPSFSWDDEDEAIAAWQAFAWQARLDPLLWEELKPNYLPMFTSERLERLGTSGNTLGHFVALVAIQFGTNELPRDQTREAIRKMSPLMRTEALLWLSAYLHQHDDGGDAALGPDQLWERVSAWLQRYWPLDPDLRNEHSSSELASIAIATTRVFPLAVGQIAPLLVTFEAAQVLEELSNSSHPTHHPQATLELLDAILDPDSHWFDDDAISRLLGQVRAADPAVADGQIFRTWSERLRVRAR